MIIFILILITTIFHECFFNSLILFHLLNLLEQFICSLASFLSEHCKFTFIFFHLPLNFSLISLCYHIFVYQWSFWFFYYLDCRFTLVIYTLIPWYNHCRLIFTMIRWFRLCSRTFIFWTLTHICISSNVNRIFTLCKFLLVKGFSFFNIECFCHVSLIIDQWNCLII